MIISASRRCDIPNYRSDWFLNGIRKGEITIPSRRNGTRKVSLKKEDVDCIVFWTKNPEPLMRKLSQLDGYQYYFQFTLTGCGKAIEPGVPDKRYMLQVFRTLSEMIGKERVIWRFDPIFLSYEYTVEYQKKAFFQISEALAGYTERCVISFIDIYGKVVPKIARFGIREPSILEIGELASYMGNRAHECGMEICTCAEKYDLSTYGIQHGHCIDAAFIKRLTGKPIFAEKDRSQRPSCGCCASLDIGTYGTCRNGCAYCYAN